MNKDNKKESKKNFDIKKLPIMPAIVDYRSRAEWEDACWRKISASKDILELLSTSSERHDLVMRASAVNAIISGKSYREIGRELWLSPQTISGIKKALDENGYKSYPGRKERKKKIYSCSKTRKYGPKGAPRRTKYGIVYMP